MSNLLIRSLCTLLAIAVLFAGLFFAHDRHREYRRIVAAHEQARRDLNVYRQTEAMAGVAVERMEQARVLLSGLEPIPRAWTTYPLKITASLDGDQAGHVLRLLGKEDAWTFLRTETLTLRSECGLEPCARFHVDLLATAYAPELPAREP